MERPNWDNYFMNIANVVKERSNCITSGPKGAILVKDKKVITTGYNGTPIGIKNCFEGGCERCKKRAGGEIQSGQDLDKCICLHAEQNAILQAAFHGTSTHDATLYSTHNPCSECAKMIINAGIKKVVSASEYADDFGTKLMKDAGIELVRIQL